MHSLPSIFRIQQISPEQLTICFSCSNWIMTRHLHVMSIFVSRIQAEIFGAGDGFCLEAKEGQDGLCLSILAHFL